MKKLNGKKSLSIFALALSCCAFSAVGAITAAATDDSTATTTVTVTDVADNFVMQEGASVRMSETKPGIRWATTITEAYWNALVTAYGNEVQLATQVTKEGETETIPCTTEVAFGEEGEFTYYAALTFEGLTADQIAQSVEWQITAQAVAMVGTEVKHSAVATDVTRSMKAVANVAILEGEDEEGDLAVYVGNKTATVGETNFYEVSDTNTTAEVSIDLENGTYTDAYIGSKKVALTVADGKTTVDTTEFIGVETGELGYVSVFNNDQITASPVRFATKLIKTQDDINSVLLSDSTITGYYVLMDDITVNSWSNKNDKGTTRANHYNMKFNGVFEGNGKTITAAPCRYGVFGALNGTVQNLNVVFTVSGQILELTGGYDSYATEQTLIAVGGNTLGVIKNLNVSLTGTAGATTHGFSLLGASNYKSIENVVANYGSIVPSTFVDGLTKYGLLFATGSNVEQISYIKDVYILSSTLDVLLTDGTNSYYAENEAGENVAKIAGVRRYGDGEDMAADYTNLDLSDFDSAWWDTTGGLPMWKATSSRDDFTVWMIDNVESDENTILLNADKTSAEIELNYGAYADLELTFTVSPADSGVVEIDGKTITAKKDGTVTVTATAEKNGVTISKDFTVVVAITPTYTWEGANLIWSTTDANLIMPTEMGTLAGVQSITNLTDGATVYDGTTWTADSLANETNAVISKQLRIVFADKAYDATVDCYTKAIVSQNDINSILIKNATTSGAYILTDNITVSSWTNSGGTTNPHLGLKFAGLFEGNGKTITAATVACGIFGQVSGTVRNLNVVFTMNGPIADWSAAHSNAGQSLISTGGAYGVGTIENLNVKVQGTVSSINGFSLFGDTSYKSIKNVVVDFGALIPETVAESTASKYGLMFASTSITTNISNVYIVSSGMKVLATDTTTSTTTCASNDTIDGATQIAGVKRYDSWALLAADYTAYDAAFWGQFYS